ncbi:AP-5 complex subunit sigma-1-like [Corticium candelabrum]|uniref:AP-5 complex subunit sigma-1-like n=1 Tax=Corticium candelabrum TaxID=121492 RepID=UPI002E27726B|nr:AP-5 complex subunit sigma-1-like [Corticium candelabrum]
MVYSFLVQTVTPGPCRLLYSTFFGCEDDNVASNDSLRSKRKRQLSEVAQQVHAEFTFRSSTTGTKYHVDGLSEEQLAAKEMGTFSLPRGCPFKESKVVLWLTQAKCGYVFIMDPDENRMLAESVLSQLVKQIDTNVRKQDEAPSKVLLKVDRMGAIVHLFLPNGQLQFMNHRVIEQYQKELDILLAGK